MVRIAVAALGMTLAASGQAAGADWRFATSEDPFRVETSRAAVLPLETYCYARDSAVKVEAVTRRGAPAEGRLIVRLDGMRAPGRITEAAAFGLGPLQSLDFDSGNVRCPGRGLSCRMEFVEVFALDATHYAAAQTAGALVVRIRTTDPQRCDLQVSIPASVFSAIGVLP